MFTWWILFGCVVGTQVRASPLLRPDSADADDDDRIESLLNINYEQESNYQNETTSLFKRNLQMPYKLLCRGYANQEYLYVNLFIFVK
jgi:hypothetical protein